jgi:hypothetical protein
MYLVVTLWQDVCERLESRLRVISNSDETHCITRVATVTCEPKIDIARTYVEVKPVVCIAMMCLIYHILLPIVLLRDLLSLRRYDARARNLFGKARSLPSGQVGEFSLDLGHGTTPARFLARNATFLLSAAHGLPSSAGGVYIGRRRG